MISLDTETTGLDLHHGAKPFLVTTCNEQGENTWWEWDVQPKDRKPILRYNDLTEIQQTINAADTIVLQNAKFDVAALYTIFSNRLSWDWDKVEDTLIAGHLLASNEPHDLASMAIRYLQLDIRPYEDAVKRACQKARSIARRDYPAWRIAIKGLPEMPSAKDSTWKYDMWLPRAMDSLISDYPLSWWTVCQEYANADSATTLALFKCQRQLLKKRGLWRIYRERLKVLPVAYGMEQRGITLSRSRLNELQTGYKAEAEKMGRVCTNIAKSCGYDLQLPKSGNNKSLLGFAFGPLGLHPQKRSSKTGTPSLDKEVLDNYLAELPGSSKAHMFIRSLREKRRRDTALSYMEGYGKFQVNWAPDGYPPEPACDWAVLHPSVNPTGTDTLRWSSSNPNEQNISKQEGFNLRYCFGPAPGREWWSLDAKNIELRIPAYEAGEEEMIDLFERENDPPYFGSYHMLVFDTLHPEKFAKHGMDCKKVYESTWYQWVKNGNFAVQYGAVEASGTADRAYHVPGAQHRIQKRFGKVAALNAAMIEYANDRGYVETMLDKTVDPKRGYPLLCTRSQHGAILPTVPLNYHVQGTAMWWMCKAMVRCQECLNTLNAKDTRGHFIVMQVHDELVFDFPANPALEGNRAAHVYNLPKIRKIQKLMEQGGKDLGIPTPVGIEYHSQTWSEGVSV